jgi:hypothetical protein
MHKAQELGTTLKDYAARFGLDVQIPTEKKPVVRKGALGSARSEDKELPTADKASAFLPVRVVSSAPTPASTSVTCRLVHQGAR